MSVTYSFFWFCFVPTRHHHRFLCECDASRKMPYLTSCIRHLRRRRNPEGRQFLNEPTMMVMDDITHIQNVKFYRCRTKGVCAGSHPPPPLCLREKDLCARDSFMLIHLFHHVSACLFFSSSCSRKILCSLSSQMEDTFGKGLCFFPSIFESTWSTHWLYPKRRVCRTGLRKSPLKVLGTPNGKNEPKKKSCVCTRFWRGFECQEGGPRKARDWFRRNFWVAELIIIRRPFWRWFRDTEGSTFSLLLPLWRMVNAKRMKTLAYRRRMQRAHILVGSFCRLVLESASESLNFQQNFCKLLFDLL